MHRRPWFLFGTVGAVVAVSLLIYGWYLTSRGQLAAHPWVYIVLCPTSIYLLATERLSFVELSVLYSGIVVTNFFVYAFVAWLVSLVGQLLYR